MVMVKATVSETLDSQMQLHLRGFEYLAQAFSPDYGPLRAHFWTPISTPLNSDPIEVFETLKTGCGLGRRPMEAVLRKKSLPKRASDKELYQLGDTLGRYYITEFGYPVVYFDPARVEEHGYIHHRSATMLSQQLLIGHKLDTEFMEDWQQSLILTAGFLGMGLIFASEGAMPPMPEQIDPILTSALFLAIKGHDSKRVALHYQDALEEQMFKSLIAAVDMTCEFQSEIDAIRKLAMADTQTKTA